MILPRRGDKIRNLVLNQNSNGKINDLLLDKLTQIIILELTYIQKMAIISEKLRNIRENTTYEMFLLIDSKHEKYLKNSNLLNFMKKYQGAYSEHEIDDIIFRLHKMERDEISYEDFQDIFTPIKVLKNEISVSNEKPNIDFDDNKSHEYIRNQDQEGDFQAEILRNELENGRLEKEGNTNENLINKISQSPRLDKDNNSELNNLNRKFVSFNNLPINSNLDENQNLDSYGNYSKDRDFQQPNINARIDDSEFIQQDNNNYLNNEEKNFTRLNTSNLNEFQKNRYSQFQDNENSINIEKLNNLNSNIELLENKIKQTRNMRNIRNDNLNEKSINIIQEYNENNFSRSREYAKKNMIQENNFIGRESENNLFPNIHSHNNHSNEEFYRRSASRYNKRNLNNDLLFYQSNGDFVSQYDKEEVIAEKENYNMKQSICNDDINDNNYHSMKNSYVIGNKKKNHSTSKLNNFSNLNIGYIPDELSRSPAMRKSIDRSKVLRRDYGCYERFRKSINYDSIDNDNEQYQNNDDFMNNIYPVKNDSQENTAINLSPERYLKNKSFNSSHNKSTFINGSTTQNRIDRTNNRSPIRKELLFSNQNYESKSPLRNNNQYVSRTLNQSNNFHVNNHTRNNRNFDDYDDYLSIENIKNLSMFSVKSDHHKIKSQNLATFLYDLVIVDSLSESNKESLSLRTDLSLRDLFEMFDTSKRNSISLVDFQDTLKKLDIYVPLPELKLTFKRFDTDMDGRLE